MSDRMIKTGKSRLSAIAVLVCMLIIINSVLYRMQADISMYLGQSSSVDDTSLEYDSAACFEEGTRVATAIQEEGTVLLQNTDDVLPLAEGTKVSVLGAMSYNYVEGGTGSAGGADDENTVMLNDALSAAGLDVNQDLWNWLEEACGGSRSADAKYDGITSSDWTGHEKINEFSKETYESYAKSLIGDYSEYAIVTFARSGAEGASPVMDYDGDGSTLSGESYLELSEDERNLLTFCKENFEHTIVLINSSAAMELGFVESEEYDVEACLWIGHPGEAGLSGVANIIAGLANPSGKLVDTYAYDLSTAPSYYNTDNNKYTNMDNSSDIYGYYQYEEGIYVGYRYYETADAEGYFDSDEFKKAIYKNDDRAASEGGLRDDEGGYENVVQYPFGYGLSYGSFSQEIESADIALELHGTNTMNVKVTNEGEYAGKQTVEIYMEAPYGEDENCGIKGRGLEKSSKVLVGFAKTGVLEPGESETVTVTFNTDDLASYDYAGYGCYVLEKGGYKFHLSSDAHTVIETADASLAESYVYNDENDGKRDSDAVVAVNQLDDVTAGDGNMLDGYLSRSNFASGMASIKTHESNLNGDKASEALGEQQKKAVELRNQESIEYTYEYYKNGVKTKGTKTLYVHAGTQSLYMEETPDGLGLDDESYAVTWDSADTDYTIADMFDEDGSVLPYDDEKWDALLNQMSLEEAVNLHGNSGWGTAAVESVGKVSDSVADGPGEAANGNIAGATWWPSAVVIASTWNVELAYEEGVAYGHQSILGGYVGAYAPAMNTHRSPFGGRNFEYYSEDGLIAGKIGSKVVEGLQDDGVMVYIKHFVLNDGDTNRNGALTWASEQAIREIYCKPYEISVKEGGALGIMACLNRIGMSWGHYGLFKTILRDEWGFLGYLITDGVPPGMADLYNPPSLCLASGVAMLARDERVDDESYTVVEGTGATDTLYGQYLLRENAHRLFYQMAATGNASGAQSAAVNAVSSDNHVWKIGWAAMDVVLVLGIAAIYGFGVHRQFTVPLLRRKKERE